MLFAFEGITCEIFRRHFQVFSHFLVAEDKLLQAKGEEKSEVEGKQEEGGARAGGESSTVQATTSMTDNWQIFEKPSHQEEEEDAQSSDYYFYFYSNPYPHEGEREFQHHLQQQQHHHQQQHQREEDEEEGQEYVREGNFIDFVQRK